MRAGRRLEEEEKWSDDERKGVMKRGKDGGRVTCPLLRLTDKEALVFMPWREWEIKKRQDEKKRETDEM